MYKLKHVYICDHCGKVTLPHTYGCMDDVWKGVPENWVTINKIHLCETCGEAYKQLQMNVQKMSETASTIPFIGDA